MKRVAKFTVTAAALVLAASLMFGCQGKNEPDRSPLPLPPSAGESAALTGQLTVMTNRVDLVENGVLAGYAKRFSAQHPGAVIHFEGIANTSEITVRLSTQTMGDVSLIPSNITNKELSNFFDPLDDGLFKDIRFADDKSYQGKRYGIASGATTEGIVYNKQAFRKAGITKAPTTLDEFYEACKKLKQAGIIPIYLNYGAQWPMQEWGEVLVSYMSGNPDYLSNMANVDNPWQMDNEWGQALQIAKTLINHGYVEPNLLADHWEDSKREIAKGSAAMYFLGNWVINQVIAAGADPGDIGFFPFPYDNKPKRYAPVKPDWFIGISKFSTNKELAKAWIEFFVKESGYGDDSGFMPVEVSKKSSLPQLNEFQSYNPVFVESRPPSDKFLEVANKAQIYFWFGDYIQELIAAPDLQEGFRSLNQKWKEARNLLFP